jgi:hypothetical protein
MAVAEPDLRDQLRELRRLKRLKQRRTKRREERHRKETADLYPWVAPLLPFLDPPKKPGRPPRTQREIERDTELARLPLVISMHKLKAVLNNNRKARNLDRAIAKRLLDQADSRLRTQKGEPPDFEYLRQLISNLIRFVVAAQLGPPPPGREKWSLRDRAIARILVHAVRTTAASKIAQYGFDLFRECPASRRGKTSRCGHGKASPISQWKWPPR